MHFVLDLLKSCITNVTNQKNIISCKLKYERLIKFEPLIILLQICDINFFNIIAFYTSIHLLQIQKEK